MQSLKRWFRIHAILPIAAASGLVCLGILVGLMTERWNLNQHRREILRGVGDQVSLGLNQNNRVLVEMAVSSTRSTIGSTDSILCNRDQLILASSQNLEFGCLGLATASGRRRWTQVIPGYQDYRLIVNLSIFPINVVFGALFLSNLLLVLSYFFFIRRIGLKISSDLLIPLQNGLQNNTPLHIVELERLRKIQTETTKAKVDLAVAQAIVQQNEQVAHDVRSPLAALHVLLSQPSAMPPDDQELLHAAITRIDTIATKLLHKPTTKKEETTGSSHLIEPIVAKMVLEKRLQYRALPNVSIRFNHEPAAQTSAAVDETELQRILSNLINNAVEALNGTGQVTLSLASPSQDWLQLDIADTGQGIPADVLPRLMNRGATFGKLGGSGLGLFHAKTTVEEWGGAFAIHSREGTGTKVSLRIPQTNAHP